ncbi:hypothetical protein [Paenibacillus cremeus]|uniref:Uncharacterized protein n=1 Tax=Paenibacillus cremeus TaxID=2163881 RepID=A0A559KCF9_9BACL|nr:hypothetical protein [Paenibacillus cremeus]TVY09826.1 hypothetical protein FPZ49_10650 [Paenibacillus cremeus]
MEQKKNPPKEFRAEYNAVKNHMHNTLGITKEDIQKIIVETVQTEIQRVINHGDIERMTTNYVNLLVQRAIDRGSYWTNFEKVVASRLKDEITNTIAEQLTIDVQVKKSVEN